MFFEHKLYKHDNTLDLVILVVSVNKSDEERSTLVVKWMKPTSMGMLHELCDDTVEISSADYSKWKQYTVEEDKQVA